MLHLPCEVLELLVRKVLITLPVSATKDEVYETCHVAAVWLMLTKAMLNALGKSSSAELLMTEHSHAIDI
jgi:DNA-binding IscR family transcriptional regulator